MKVLLYQGTSVVSRGIRLQTRSKYSHAAVQFSDRRILEAWHVKEGWKFWEGCVRWITDPWDGHAPGTPVDTYMVNEFVDEQRALAFAMKQVGKAYDFKAVFRFLSRKKAVHEDEKWFCSELVAEIFEHGDCNLLHGNSAMFSPRDIALSPKLDYFETRTK